MQIRLNVQIVREPARPRRRGRTLAVAGLLALGLFVPLAFASDVFTDVPASHPFHDQIGRAYAAGMIGSCGPTTFCPGNTVTKGMAASQYDKAFGLDGNPRPFTPTWRQVNIETGGAAPPFTVDSSQKVVNLNADRLDGKDSTDFSYSAGAGLAQTGNQFRVADGGIAPAMMQAFPSARVTGDRQYLFNYYDVPLSFNAEEWDTAGFHDSSTNNSRLTAPIAGLYSITASVAFESGYSTGTRRVSLRVNGTDVIAANLVPGAADPLSDVTVSTLWRLSAGDYVEVFVYQSTINPMYIASAPPRTPAFAMAWLGP